MRVGIWLGVAALAFAGACTSSNERFPSAASVADALREGGVSCDFVPEAAMRGPIQVPAGESWGGCNLAHGGLGIYVLGDKDALTRLESDEAKSADDTPRIYWVYGDNWIVAAESRAVQAEVLVALGGAITDNTEL